MVEENSSEYIQEVVEEIAECYVNGMYDVFKKPGMKGENFIWEDFPNLVASQTSSLAFIYFEDWDSFSRELKKNIRQQVYDTAKEYAQKKLTGKEK